MKGQQKNQPCKTQCDNYVMQATLGKGETPTEESCAILPKFLELVNIQKKYIESKWRSEQKSVDSKL